MADFIRNGYGQVEPNHLSAQKTGQIYAQLPAKSTITMLENGQFVKYDYASNEVNFTGAGEWMMVFNEVHTYDERDRFYKDFAMLKADAVDGVIVPRVIKTNVGDIFTTNTLGVAAVGRRTDVKYTTTAELAVGNILIVDSATGYLVYKASPVAADGPQFKIVKVYTLGDGQPAVKVQRIA